jgi:hypothetical protein
MNFIKIKTLGVLMLLIGLNSYSQISMDYYHGSANINIHLYEISIDGISIPISLTYTTGGIPLSQQATAVGLGWNLNAELSVNRFIKDVPDDHYYYEASGYYKTGWIYNYWYPDLYSFPYIQDFNNADTSNPNTALFLKDINKYLDTQPDDFYYTTASGNGHFIFDEIPVDNYEQTINKLFIGTNLDTVIHELAYDPILGHDVIGAFTVFDEIGNRYRYDEKETSASSIRDLYNDPDWEKQYGNVASISGKYQNPIRKFFTDMAYDNYENRALKYGGVDFTSVGYSTDRWKISDIETPNGNKITFNYEEVVYQSDNFTYEVFQNIDAYGNRLIKMQSQLDQFAPITYCTEKSKRIKSIETDKVKIIFLYNTLRTDVGTQIPPGSEPAKQLDRILVYAKSGSLLPLIKEFRFIYSYFDCEEVPETNLYNNDVNAKKRLRLDRIEIADGIDVLSSYCFEYDYGVNRKLPSRFSKAQDFWGFYNGYTSNQTLLPTTYVYIDPIDGDKFSVYEDPINSPDRVLEWSNRNPNHYVSSIGSLNKIIYPTKGFTELQYEQNTFMYNGHKYDGPGVRVSKITNKTDSDDPTPNVKKFIYEGKDENQNEISFGKITSMPEFGFFDPTGSWPMNQNNPPYDPYKGGFANSNSIINDYSDGLLGYTRVTIVHGENGESGSTEMNFENSVMAGEPDNYLGFEKPNIYPIKTQSDILAGKHFNHTVAGSKLDFNNHGYPFVIGANYSWKRGFLLSVKNYDIAGSKIHELINEPEYFFANGNEPKIIYALKQGNFENNRKLTTCTNRLQGALSVTAKYPILTGVGCRIKTTTETNYDINRSLQQVVSTDFYYNNYNQISNVKTTNSTGTVIQNSVKYPTDYTYTGNENDDMSKALYKMRMEYHMLDYPVQTTTERMIGNGKEITEGSTNLYKLYDGETKKIVLPSIQMQLQNSTPVSNLENSYINSYGIFVFNQTYYKPVNYYDKYNVKGLPVETFRKDGSSVTNIYAGDSLSVIASVANARQNECAYGGFENGDYFFSISFFGPLNPDAYTGEKSIMLTSTASKLLVVGNEAKKHSGYKACVWVKGSTTASISIGVSNSPSSFRTTSNKGPNNEWHLIEAELPYDEYKSNITNQLTIEVRLSGNGTDKFDDIRILPMDAVMNSTVYNSRLQTTATLDERNIPTRYVYDSHGRNTLVQDQFYNIIKKTEYHIKP